MAVGSPGQEGDASTDVVNQVPCASWAWLLTSLYSCRLTSGPYFGMEGTFLISSPQVNLFVLVPVDVPLFIHWAFLNQTIPEYYMRIAALYDPSPHILDSSWLSVLCHLGVILEFCLEGVQYATG